MAGEALQAVAAGQGMREDEAQPAIQKMKGKKDAEAISKAVCQPSGSQKAGGKQSRLAACPRWMEVGGL